MTEICGRESETNSTKKGDLTAYEVPGGGDMPIEPASVSRKWMDESDQRFAYRCLPLVIANQSGWIIRCPIGFTARWNGGKRMQDLRFWFPRGKRETRILSHFGDGIITFAIPYLFRTSLGVNLWVKGPSNWLKDGVQPLEGVVETDWSHSTFTMNWKVTRPDTAIRFKQGDPICMICPIARGYAEQLEPVVLPLSGNKELCAQYTHWRESRNEFNKLLREESDEAVKQGWQRDYMLGVAKEGEQFAEHQTGLKIQEFTRK
jgi:hypothetical protein